LIHRKLADKEGRIARLLRDTPAGDQAIAELYVVSISRPPTAAELADCPTIIAAAPDRREGLQDVLWALCNSREFLLNH